MLLIDVGRTKTLITIQPIQKTGWTYPHNGLGDRTSQYVYMTRPGTTALTGTINYYYYGLRMLKKAKNPDGFNNGVSLRYFYDKAGHRLENWKSPFRNEGAFCFSKNN